MGGGDGDDVGEMMEGMMGRIPPPPPDVAEKDRLKIVKKNMTLWSLFKKLNRCDVC